jgi:hypothetical protein
MNQIVHATLDVAGTSIDRPHRTTARAAIHQRDPERRLQRPDLRPRREDRRAVQRRHPTHPGALHYIIHAYDDPAHASQGLAAARAYSTVAPDASHAQHMTSHIFVALGMWDDVVAANEASIRTVAKTSNASVASAAGCGHVAIRLHYAYLQQGRLADACQLSSACQDRSTKSQGAAMGYSEIACRTSATSNGRTRRSRRSPTCRSCRGSSTSPNHTRRPMTASGEATRRGRPRSSPGCIPSAHRRREARWRS